MFSQDFYKNQVLRANKWYISESASKKYPRVVRIQTPRKNECKRPPAPPCPRRLPAPRGTTARAPASSCGAEPRHSTPRGGCAHAPRLRPHPPQRPGHPSLKSGTCYTSIAPQIVTPERRAPTPASLQPPAALITPETSRFTAYHCPRMYSTLGHCSFHVPGLMTEKERNGEKQTGRGAKYPPPRLGVLRPRAAYSLHVPTSEGNLKTVSYTQRI